jgi:hypothetical protein
MGNVGYWLQHGKNMLTRGNTHIEVTADKRRTWTSDVDLGGGHDELGAGSKLFVF